MLYLGVALQLIKRNILHALDDGLIMYARVALVYVNLPRRLVLQPIVGW